MYQDNSQNYLDSLICFLPDIVLRAKDPEMIKRRFLDP